MADHEKHPYYGLDSGAPHMQDEDYRKMGLGSVQEASATCPETGPSNNPDADERIRTAVEQKLETNGFVDASRIRVTVHGSVVRLEGTAEHRYARSRAEDLAREVEGVASVQNHVAVQPDSEETAGGPVLTTHEPGIRDGSTQRS